MIKDPHAVVWKDIIYSTPKVERDLIHLLERVCKKQYGYKVTKKTKTKTKTKNKTTKKRKYNKHKYKKKSKWVF